MFWHTFYFQGLFFVENMFVRTFTNGTQWKMMLLKKDLCVCLLWPSVVATAFFFFIWVVMFASLCVWWIRTKVKACVHFVQSLLLFVNVFLFQSKCVKTVSDWYCLHVFFFQQWRYSRMLWGSRCATVALILLLWGAQGSSRRRAPLVHSVGAPKPRRAYRSEPKPAVSLLWYGKMITSVR